jgi:hypothetical protein
MQEYLKVGLSSSEISPTAEEIELLNMIMTQEKSRRLLESLSPSVAAAGKQTRVFEILEPLPENLAMNDIEGSSFHIHQRTKYDVYNPEIGFAKVRQAYIDLLPAVIKFLEV